VKRILIVTCALMLCVAGNGFGQGQEKRTGGFGALDALTADGAKNKLAGWLKEVGKSDAATTAKLDSIWKDESRSIIDRVADSLALGDPVAAKLMLEARDPAAPAPIILPDVFKDDKRSAFFRANLALVYSRALTNRRVYEEALDTLKQFGADQVADPSAYLFHRAVCEHALQRKADATKSITRLLDEGAAISPDRYKIVATLMLLDMHTWKDKDLGDIARKMENIERRLEIARGGPETQRQQREVLNRLDEIIKKLENQNKNKKKPGDGPPKDGPPMPGDGEGECPDGGGPPGPGGSGPPKGVNPSSSPATDSANAGGTSTGVVNEEKFKKLVADWGRLPPAEQRRALQDITQGMSPRHREAIVNYFQNLTNPALNRK
jgi:polyhydroxyalkanoate synthesis regulator phasin